MEYIIKFVGIIMIVSAVAPGDHYRALLPLTAASNVSCNGTINAPAHEAYVRVANAEIAESSQWPSADIVDCVPTTQNCKLFRITSPSDLEIVSGIDSGTAVRESPSYCLVPQLRREFASAASVTAVNESATMASLVLPGGTLTAEQIKVTGAIYASLHVPAKPGTPVQKIVVLAIDRATKLVRSVVVQPGATIMLVSATPTMAKNKLDAASDDDAAGHPEHNHFTIYNKLLTGAEICTIPAMPRPCTGTFGPTNTGELGCSNSGCCSP